MNDKALESLLSSLESPQFAPGHEARLRTRLMRGHTPRVQSHATPSAQANAHRLPRHHLRRPMVAPWAAMAALVLLTAMLAVRSPTTDRGNVESSLSLPVAQAHEPVIFCVDLFPSRHQSESLDIRRWSSHSGVSR